MSLVPFETQIEQKTASSYLRTQNYSDTQNTQKDAVRIVFIYHDRLTERQTINMQQCQQLLRGYLDCVVRQAKDLNSLPKRTRFFVLPAKNKELLAKITSQFDRPMVYLPRAIIEARSYYNTKLPNRPFVISLGLFKAKIFIVKLCNTRDLRAKISELNGQIVASFDDSNINVVITNRADDKYCIRAFKRDIPVVSVEWIDDVYRDALENDTTTLNFNAIPIEEKFQIKPFFGLSFKLSISDPGQQVKSLITENQGKVVYGNQDTITHLVDSKYIDTNLTTNANDNSTKTPLKSMHSKPAIKIVDVDFLKTCVDKGYHLGNRDYLDHLMANSKTTSINSSTIVNVKQELIEASQTSSEKGENCTPTPPQPTKSAIRAKSPSQNGTADSNRKSSQREKHSSPMLPPPTKHRQQLSKQSEQNDMIWRALSKVGNVQTQQVSTQMRRLPDSELQIEKTCEPSQQLYWDDTVSRRH